MQHLELWTFLAGLGLFLYGMGQLEHVLKNTSGRPFKLFLKRNTQHLFKAIVGGTVVTGIVQSSTVVSLIVLAFVESGIITFRNALGVILGANIGTTLTGWLVVMIGFKLNVIAYALPVIAIAALGVFAFDKLNKIRNLLTIFLAIGILFLGLGYMKEGAQQIVADFDLTPYTQHGIVVFVIIGLILTSIIQSSSAVVAITLTALHAGVITFPSAASIVIGAGVGTTLTVLIWGIKGSADKKRTAWGNFYFNIFCAVIAFVFLPWIIYFIEDTLHIADPLIGLAAFQTLINLVAVILFIPFINVFAKWLERKFTTDSSSGRSYISNNLPVLPLLVTDALRNETLNLFKKTLLFNKSLLSFKESIEKGFIQNIKSFTQAVTNVEGEYNRLKQTQGDILRYYAQIQENKLDNEEATIMLQYIHAARQSVFAAKAIKDIHHNLKEFESSANDSLYQQRASISYEWNAFDAELIHLMNLSDKKELTFELDKRLNAALAQEGSHNAQVFTKLKNNQLNEVEGSTLMNVYRELLSCKKLLLAAFNNIENPYPALFINVGTKADRR